jgi:hypothetical protein
LALSQHGVKMMMMKTAAAATTTAAIAKTRARTMCSIFKFLAIKKLTGGIHSEHESSTLCGIIFYC